MQRVKNILNASVVCRWLFALTDWLGAQWQNSRAVQAFLSPSERGEGASRSSLFARLWNWPNSRLLPLTEGWIISPIGCPSHTSSSASP